ncbi:hypothetical protein [Deinococcus sp.]|uniref:YncE family protein n=1 Tax=Deinococcus sp. TaxID=47478 RepID=UPI0025E3F208|nr:hypothetical protein [Deinococcus sp.]
MLGTLLLVGCKSQTSSGTTQSGANQTAAAPSSATQSSATPSSAIQSSAAPSSATSSSASSGAATATTLSAATLPAATPSAATARKPPATVPPKPGRSPGDGALPGVRASPTLGAANPTMPVNIYAHAAAGQFSPAVRGVRPLVYVPNGKDSTVSVIDPQARRVLRTFKVDREPQHVVPSHDLKTLWVASDKGRQSVTPIDPRTGKVGQAVPTLDPYNLYFTPDGLHAVVVAENSQRLDFVDPRTMQPQFSIPVPCRGINHMDFSPSGQSVIAACEFSGDVLHIDFKFRAVLGSLHLGGMPQDVKLSPDGQVYYVADMMRGGLYLIDGRGKVPRKLGFIPTGKGTHGLYPSRDATRLFISNRGEGSVSVLNFATRKLIAKWLIPGGGSPDMGSVSPDGKELWLSGRYDDVVYVFSTRTGKVVSTIKVGKGPHGLTYFPQPGRYSLGHTDNYR